MESQITNHKPQTNSGFTLIEVLIAIFIFSLALTATSYVLTFNLQNAAAVRNNFVASGLAQEGMEVVRSIRDRDWFLGNAFGTSIPDGAYRIQWDSQALIALGVNPFLRIDSANGVFSYDTGNDVIFKRTVTITTITPNVEKRIIVNINWVGRGNVSRSLSAEEHLFNWK